MFIRNNCFVFKTNLCIHTQDKHQQIKEHVICFYTDEVRKTWKVLSETYPCILSVKETFNFKGNSNLLWNQLPLH